MNKTQHQFPHTRKTAEHTHSAPATPGARLTRAYLRSWGISGLFLNNDEVLMPGFCSWFLPLALAEDFFGENTFFAFPFNVLGVSLAAVFLAGREDVSFLRFAGGACRAAWRFLLVACACCGGPQRKERRETRQSVQTDPRVKPGRLRTALPAQIATPRKSHNGSRSVCGQTLGLGLSPANSQTRKPEHPRKLSSLIC